MDKRVIRVWGTDTYVQWENEDGSIEGAYNLMYDTESGRKVLRRLLEEQMQVDYSQVGADSKMEVDP